MKSVFRWLQMGFVLFKGDSVVKNLHDIKSYIDLGRLDEMFSNGYYFFNKTHQVRVASIEEYNTYFGEVHNENQ